MEMGAKKEIESVEVQGEFYQCPSCGYTDGFHVSFKAEPSGKTAEVFLICPSCHSRYRMGWSAAIAPSPGK